MSDRTYDTEICVIGAGPAGAAFALRMARLGHQVLVLERSVFPRPHIGEVLTSGIWPLLDILGVSQAVRSAGFLAVTEARVRWAGRQAVRMTSPITAPGLTVDRGRFDMLLLGAARSAGARVLQPAVAGRPRKTADGWEVTASTPSAVRTVRARFLADASGRARVLGASRAHRSVPTLALHARWRGAAGDAHVTRLEAGPRGWFWGAPLPDGGFRAFAFLDPGVVRRNRTTRASLETFYRELLASTELLHGLRYPELEGRVEACDATCYFDPESISDRSIKLGDASSAIDALSSSGVQKALQSALAGSAAVHTVLRVDADTDAALSFYLDSQKHAVEAHAEWTGGYYGEQRLYAGQVFWRRRARSFRGSAEAVPRLSLRDAFSRRARLAPNAAMVDVPCIVGDQVARRRALRHPRLRRPVAYLGEIELAPLLETIEKRGTLGEAIQVWSLRLPAPMCLRVADWLCARGLLEFD